MASPRHIYPCSCARCAVWAHAHAAAILIFVAAQIRCSRQSPGSFAHRRSETGEISQSLPRSQELVWTASDRSSVSGLLVDGRADMGRRAVYRCSSGVRNPSKCWVDSSPGASVTLELISDSAVPIFRLVNDAASNPFGLDDTILTRRTIWSAPHYVCPPAGR